VGVGLTERGGVNLARERRGDVLVDGVDKRRRDDTLGVKLGLGGRARPIGALGADREGEVLLGAVVVKLGADLVLVLDRPVRGGDLVEGLGEAQVEDGVRVGVRGGEIELGEGTLVEGVRGGGTDVELVLGGDHRETNGGALNEVNVELGGDRVGAVVKGGLDGAVLVQSASLGLDRGLEPGDPCSSRTPRW